MGERNRHHLWFPRSKYVTQFEKLFRDLPCHVIRMDEAAHRLLHAHQNPPTKPSREEMSRAVDAHADGECSCYRKQQALPVKRLR